MEANEDDRSGVVGRNPQRLRILLPSLRNISREHTFEQGLGSLL
jgi:hypothetical protein